MTDEKVQRYTPELQYLGDQLNIAVMEESDYGDYVLLSGYVKLETNFRASSALHASLVTKIKATRELIYKTQIAAVGGTSKSDCLEVVDGVLGEIEGRLEGKN